MYTVCLLGQIGILLVDKVPSYRTTVKVLNVLALVAYPWTNSADPDQTASEEALRLVSSLFAILTSILRNPALITNILFGNRMRKVFEILEHLP